MVAEPLAFGAGVKVKRPVASITGWAMNRALLSLEIVVLSVWPASSGPPPGPVIAKPAIDCVPASSLTVTVGSGLGATVGGSFTGSTVMVTSAVPVAPVIVFFQA